MSTLTALRTAGLHVEALPNGRLRVAPATRLTDALRALIRDHKVEIMAELVAGERDMSATAIRRRFLEGAALLLAELPPPGRRTENDNDYVAYCRDVLRLNEVTA